MRLPIGVSVYKRIDALAFLKPLPRVATEQNQQGTIRRRSQFVTNISVCFNVAYWDAYAEPSDASFRIRDRFVSSGSGFDRLVVSHTTGNVGIGLANQHSKLSVLNNGSVPYAGWIGGGTPLFAGFGENASGNADFVVSMASATALVRPVFIGKRSRGTLASPGVVANGDYLATFRASGYDGANFQNSAAIEFLVDDNPASGSVPTSMSFTTGSSGSNRTERLRIGSNGDVAINDSQLVVQRATGAVAIGKSLDVRGGGHFLSVGIDIGSLVIGQNGTPPAVAINATGINFGVIAQANTTGIVGYGKNIGVQGFATSGSSGPRGSTGVYGEGKWAGVYGTLNSEDIGSYEAGVYGDGNGLGVGVEGHSNDSRTAVLGSSFLGIGVEARSTASYGVYAYSSDGPYAGYFQGDVYSTGTYQSSGRNLKKDIAEVTNALSIIDKLKPKTYNFRQDGAYKLMHLPQGKRYGLIAEDVEDVLPALVKQSEFDPQLAQTGLRKKDSTASEKIAFKAVNYTELISLLVKGMQEMNEKTKEENNELKQQLARQQQQIDELRQLVNKLASERPVTGTNATGIYLEQNTPNPAKGSTIIHYQIPDDVSAAHLTLINAKGQLLKQLSIGRGAGQLALNTATLPAGVYTYSLWIDGRQAATKQLVIAR